MNIRSVNVIGCDGKMPASIPRLLMKGDGFIYSNLLKAIDKVLEDKDNEIAFLKIMKDRAETLHKTLLEEKSNTHEAVNKGAKKELESGVEPF